MSNILSLEAQKEIWKAYRARFIVAGSWVAIATAALAALALLPMYIGLHSGQLTARTPLQQKSAETKNERAEVTRTLSLISALAPYISATTSPTELIMSALSLRPQGVVVDHVVYSSGAKGEMRLYGSSGTRDGINAYRQALQSNPLFKTATVPVNNLVGAQGGQFSVTLTGTF